jgi:23S rRNA pseudouridine2605 synthase
MSLERLQKILAQAGIASRRKAEELIQLGQVTVNGKVAKIGDKADFTQDAIKVEGKLLHQAENLVYVAFYKPKGVISMMADPENRPTLADYLTKVKARVYPIGRLDFNSEGILLLTNDGALVEKIQKSDRFPRAYHVKIKGHVTAEMIQRLTRGGKVGNSFVKPHSVRIHDELNKKTLIEIVFLSAGNVDVKTYFESKGFLIERMTRTAFGHITLHGLIPGQYRLIPQSKLQALIDQPDLGIKAIEFKASKKRSILPKDQRLKDVDTDGKVRIKAAAGDRSVIKPSTVGGSKIGARKTYVRDSRGAEGRPSRDGARARPLAFTKKKDRGGSETSERPSPRGDRGPSSRTSFGGTRTAKGASRTKRPSR